MLNSVSFVFCFPSQACFTFYFDLFLCKTMKTTQYFTYISVNMNACGTVDKGLGSTKHSPQLCWYYS